MPSRFLRFYEYVVLTELPEYFPMDSRVLRLPGISDKHGNYSVVDKYNRNIQDYWRPKNIRYNLNEHKFRTSHDFESLKDNDFLLAVGCSITMGVGIDEDSRWSNQLERRLNIPVVNLGVGASDINTVIRNVSTYIANYSKPKAIIIQLPELTRFSFLQPTGISQCRSYFFVHEFARDGATELELQGADYHFNQEVAIQQLVMLQTVMSAFHIPVIYFSVETLDLTYYKNQSANNYTTYYNNHDNSGVISDLFPEDSIYDFRRRFHDPSDFEKYDGILMEYGRDYGHPGDLQNTAWADKLVRILSSKI